MAGRGGLWVQIVLGYRLVSLPTSSLPPDPPNCEKVTPPTPATLTDRSPLPGWTAPSKI